LGLGFRVSSAGRTLTNAGTSKNPIPISSGDAGSPLFDGDAQLFENWTPRFCWARKTARPLLHSELQRLTRERLARYGNTIFISSRT